MKLPTSAAARGLFARVSMNSSLKTVRRAYAGGEPDPELMKIHNVLPKNYKSFAGQPNVDQPAFNYDWAFTKQVDPTETVPAWSYRGSYKRDFVYMGDKLIWQIASTIFWGWMIWRFYWGGYKVFLNEPEWTSSIDITKWTDEELGIPNDDTMPVRIYEW